MQEPTTKTPSRLAAGGFGFLQFFYKRVSIDFAYPRTQPLRLA